eukprot:TRINITY_DN1205_c0_g1_i3.p1 TRINITY_DN1205_c0_g1~~TRINITY_DN1205_c0_g1_i3.p1  ORF type:complete len:170 (-),score=16.92 TRINITY_DN1205_c0_g1_i3:186-695(-)
MQRGLVGSEMCIRDRYQRRVHGDLNWICIHENTCGKQGKITGMAQVMVWDIVSMCMKDPLESACIVKCLLLKDQYAQMSLVSIRIRSLGSVLKMFQSARNSKKNPKFLCFENITLAPYCRSLIKKELLSQDNIDYINTYHKRVYDTLSPMLKDDEITLNYLAKECAPLQ